MPKQQRHKTQYPGVYYVTSENRLHGRQEKIFYVVYRQNNKLIEEKAGRQYRDDMTAARAAGLRAERMAGQKPSNSERRLEQKQEEQRWTIEHLWSTYAASRSDSKSLQSDLYNFRKYLASKFGAKVPEEITHSDIDQLRTSLLTTKKPQTVKHILSLLLRTIRFGSRRQYCKELNFPIAMPKVNNIKTEDLTPEELRRLLQAIAEEPLIHVANLMKLVLYTGMRRGEMFRLQWDDLDFDRGFIHIRNPKGGVDQKIPMNEAARELLQHHPHQESPYVFPGRNGNQRTDINHQVNRIKERAGLPKDFRALHGLRHVYASMLASSGEVDLYTLQRLLTHKSPQMTQRYAHLRDEVLKKGSEVAGKIIDQIEKAK